MMNGECDLFNNYNSQLTIFNSQFLNAKVV
jgi:hypothetical protein